MELLTAPTNSELLLMGSAGILSVVVIILLAARRRAKHRHRIVQAIRARFQDCTQEVMGSK